MFSLFYHGPILEDTSGFALSVTSQGKRHNSFLGQTSKTTAPVVPLLVFFHEI